MSENYITWADGYPDIAEGAREHIPWPCERFATDLGSISQPVVAKGPDEELITTTWRRAPDEPTHLYNSTDGGKTWSKLSEIPPHWETGPDTQFINTCSGCGYLKDGTIIVQYMNQFSGGRRPLDPAHDETHRNTTYLVRSTDHGKSWSDPVALDPWPYQAIGGISRIYESPCGRLYLPMGRRLVAKPGKPLMGEQRETNSTLYVSENSGQTWRCWGIMGTCMGENDVLSLDEDRMIAVHRFQRKKLDSDPADLVSPMVLNEAHRARKPDCQECRDPKAPGGHSVYKQTAIAFSDNAGRSWSRPRIVTNWVQQTGCIVQLSDGTLILPFSHKDEGQGQRFIVSYDQGQFWSKAIFELNKDGMYANSTALKDDTIVTVFSVESHSGGKNCLETLRWKAPPKQVVSQKGFFKPAAVE